MNINFIFGRSEQLKLHEKLNRNVGPGPATFYRDACAIIATRSRFGAATNLVGHLMREIESALRKGPLQPIAYSAGSQPSEVKMSQKDEIRLILEALELRDGEPVAVAWLELAGQLQSYAHRRALAAPRPLDDEFLQMWGGFERVLATVVDRLEARTLQFYSILDGLLAKPSPSKADADTLYNQVPQSAATLGYFFGRLEHAQWLPALRKKGYFERIPPPVVEEDGVRFPPFPQADYLAKLAASHPGEVSDVLTTLEPTGNIRAYYDLMEVVLRLPAERVAQLLPTVQSWLSAPHEPIGVERTGEVCIQLATQGYHDEAFALAGTLLEVMPDPRVADADEDYRPQPRFRLRSFNYNNILKQILPALLAADSPRVPTLLMELLSRTNEYSARPAPEGATNDFSVVWLHTVAEGPEAYNEDPRGKLVTALRDTLLAVAETDPTRVTALIAELESYPWQIHKRLALFLLERAPTNAVNLIEARLTSGELFHDYNLRQEYAPLLHSQFKALSEGAQRRILELIEESPRVEVWREHAANYLGRPPTEDEEHHYAQAQRRDWLALIVDDLPQPWRERFDAYVAEDGAPRSVAAVGRVETRWGNESPKTSAELNELDADALFDYLKVWAPPEDAFSGPSYEGLGQELAKLAEGDPQRFTEQAPRLRELEPTYVRSVLLGWTMAIKAGSVETFDWAAALDLCQFLSAQPGTTQEEQGLERDQDWRWSRHQVLDLLREGFDKTDSNPLPFSLRDQVWQVLEPLTEDPNPTPTYEARFGNGNLDPFHISLNTTRGRAMHAVIHYAVWVHRQLDEKDRQQGFSAMPEVRRVLDAHLTPEAESSLAVRAVYGANIAVLMQLDETWVGEKVSQLLPQETSLEPLRAAAWESYLLYGPYTTSHLPKLYTLLKEAYVSAVAQLQSPRTTDQPSRIEDHISRLGQHLMILYRFGQLDFRESSVLRGFFEFAPEAVRGRALHAAADILLPQGLEGASELLPRAQDLWVWRMEDAKSKGSYTELPAFGFWFTSHVLDERWALDQLLEVLSLAGRVENDYGVVDRLVELASREPLRAVECLSFAVRNYAEEWSIYGWLRKADKILDVALESRDNRAKLLAREVINRLAAQGQVQFRSLLER